MPEWRHTAAKLGHNFQRWIDEYLKWNPKEYGGVDQIWIPAIDIWTPDIFINNLYVSLNVNLVLIIYAA